jgi:SAM-dependent methyltransferase
MRVDPTNAEQALAWDGDEGAYWAAHAERFDRAMAPYQGPFMAAADVVPGATVLDVGCGTGQTTREAAIASGSGLALGVDLSSRMIELAQRLAADEAVANAAFEHTDAQIHPFGPASFDAAISRTGTMFFGDAAAAFANVARALKPGAGFTQLVWQGPEPTEWIRELSGALAVGRDLPMPPAGAPGPFALAGTDRVRTLLTDAGFRDVEIAGHEAPMWFGADADDAFEFVLGLMGWMLLGLDGATRAQALEDLRHVVSAHATADGVLFRSAAWLVTASRR